jgi:hypothetical protein
LQTLADIQDSERAQTNNQAAQAISQAGNTAINQAQAGEDPD